MPEPARATTDDVRIAEPPSGAASWVDATAGRAAAAVFGLASYARTERSLHPDGAACRAVLTLDPVEVTGARLLDAGGEWPCVVRLSRAIGLPPGRRDILGLAVRILGSSGETRQDLLFSSVLGTGLFARHVLTPTRSFTERPLSTIAPYRTATGAVTLVARGRGLGPATTIEAAAVAFAAGELTFELEAFSRVRPPVLCGRVRGGEPLRAEEAERLRFNPYRCEPDLEPAGLVNALRRRAYASSQAGRARRVSGNTRGRPGRG